MQKQMVQPSQMLFALKLINSGVVGRSTLSNSFSNCQTIPLCEIAATATNLLKTRRLTLRGVFYRSRLSFECMHFAFFCIYIEKDIALIYAG